MDFITVILADLCLTAVRQDPPQDEKGLYKSQKLIVTCTDKLSGKSHTAMMNDDELCAVVSCAISNDGEGSGNQYEIASKACEGFPTECRPIP